MFYHTFLIFLILLTSCSDSNSTEKKSEVPETFTWKGIEINIADIEERTDQLDMLSRGQKVGSWTWKVTKTNHEVHFNDISILNGYLREDASGTVPFNFPEINTLKTSLSYESGDKTSSELVWDRDHVHGTLNNSNGETTQFSKKYTNTVPRFILIGLLPYIDVTKLGDSITLFSNEEATTFNVSIETTPNVDVTIGDKTFSTTQIDLMNTDGHGVSNRFFVTQTSPKRIIKAEVIGSTLTMEINL